jgi:hypothetical protein
MFEYYLYTDLIKLGFTPRLIAKFFDPADIIKPNPKRNRSAFIRLYSRRRVDAIIPTDRFMREYVKLDDKRIARRNAVNN